MDKGLNIGQIVCLKAIPNRREHIIKKLSTVGGKSRYRVFHSPNDLSEYHAD